MLPSIINLMIGGASLVRGTPGIQSLLLRFMPEDKPVLVWDRHWIAAILAGPIIIGPLYAIGAFPVAVVSVAYVMPWIGLGLLELAQILIAYDLPLRLIQLF